MSFPSCSYSGYSVDPSSRLLGAAVATSTPTAQPLSPAERSQAMVSDLPPLPEELELSNNQSGQAAKLRDLTCLDGEGCEEVLACLSRARFFKRVIDCWASLSHFPDEVQKDLKLWVSSLNESDLGIRVKQGLLEAASAHMRISKGSISRKFLKGAEGLEGLSRTGTLALLQRLRSKTQEDLEAEALAHYQKLLSSSLDQGRAVADSFRDYCSDFSNFNQFERVEDPYGASLELGLEFFAKAKLELAKAKRARNMRDQLMIKKLIKCIPLEVQEEARAREAAKSQSKRKKTDKIRPLTEEKASLKVEAVLASLPGLVEKWIAILGQSHKKALREIAAFTPPTATALTSDQAETVAEDARRWKEERSLQMETLQGRIKALKGRVSGDALQALRGPLMSRPFPVQVAILEADLNQAEGHFKADLNREGQRIIGLIQGVVSEKGPFQKALLSKMVRLATLNKFKTQFEARELESLVEAGFQRAKDEVSTQLELRRNQVLDRVRNKQDSRWAEFERDVLDASPFKVQELPVPSTVCLSEEQIVDLAVKTLKDGIAVKSEVSSKRKNYLLERVQELSSRNTQLEESLADSNRERALLESQVEALLHRDEDEQELEDLVRGNPIPVLQNLVGNREDLMPSYGLIQENASAGELNSLLEKTGFECLGQKGSHRHFIHPKGGRKSFITLAYHDSQNLKVAAVKGVFLKIAYVLQLQESAGE